MADAPSTAAPSEATPAATPAPEGTAPAVESAAPAVPKIYIPDPPRESAQTEAAPPEETKKVDPIAPKLALLMKREAKERKEREAKEKAFQEREAKLAEREAKLGQAKDPVAALEAQGYTYEQATEFIINGKKPTPQMEQDAALKSMRADLEQLQAHKAAEEQATRDRSVAAYKREINTFVAGSDQFEYINKLGKQDMIFAVIDGHAREQGELLGGSPEKAIELAAAQIEQYLETEYAERLLTTKKLQAKLAASREARPPANSASQKQPPKSLSNSQAAAVPPRASVQFTSPKETINALIEGGLRLYKKD